MGWSPKEVLVLLFVDVPSVIGAAGELVEAGGFFSLEIVELGLCVFGIPAEGHIETSNRKKERQTDGEGSHSHRSWCNI